LLLLPPQPVAVTSNKPKLRTTRMQILARNCRRMRPVEMPKIDRPRTAASCHGTDLEGVSSAVEGPLVVMLIWSVLAPVPFGVTEELAGAHEAPVGAPLQVTEMDWLKPFNGVSVRVKLVLWPGDTLCDPGEADREKSGGGATTCTETALEVLAAKFESP
jgi:hypothetical protein